MISIFLMAVDGDDILELSDTAKAVGADEGGGCIDVDDTGDDGCWCKHDIGQFYCNMFQWLLLLLPCFLLIFYSYRNRYCYWSFISLL